MVRTRVGYCGGSKPNPTYRSIGDHAETIQIDFDPAKLTYDQLLDLFWQRHSPCSKSGSRQYMSAVFAGSPEQQRLALASRARWQKKFGRTIHTEILPLDRFYLAEDYHQKYELRQNPDIARELLAVYPDLNDFVNSTAATRLNGYLGGHGSAEQLRGEIAGLGLSDEARQRLLDRVR